MTTRRIRKKLFSLDELETAVRDIVSDAHKNGVNAALAGGLAMQFYGSDRMTADIDFVADDFLSFGEARKLLSFGGESFFFRKIPTDWIVRRDAFRALYEDALRHALPSEEGYSVVTPEYLAAMKLAAGRTKDEADLLFLLGPEVGLDRAKTREIIFDRVGGQFAVDAFVSLCDEADWRATRTKR